MRALLIALLVLTASSFAVEAPSPAQLPTIEQFLKIRAPQGATLGTDGALYVRDFPDGIVQLYKITPVDGDYSPAKAKTTKITQYPDGIGGSHMSPDGKTILILHAVGGNENYQIAALDTTSGKITELTHDPKVKYEVNHWLSDSSGFTYSGNQESPNDFYIY